jgi:hypothetical protein
VISMAIANEKLSTSSSHSSFSLAALKSLPCIHISLPFTATRMVCPILKAQLLNSPINPKAPDLSDDKEFCPRFAARHS